jgi:cold shock CspA family protein
MKYFGTLKSFDTVKGLGEIKQEAGGDDLHFEKSAISWDAKTAPAVGQRLSYERGNNDKSEARALNLQTI